MVSSQQVKQVISLTFQSCQLESVVESARDLGVVIDVSCHCHDMLLRSVDWDYFTFENCVQLRDSQNISPIFYFSSSGLGLL